VIGVVCPVCVSKCGYRRISDYIREVRELWPFRVGWVSVSRFQCRGAPGRLPTFSMLPYQLVPYCRYTLGTMVHALLMWREFWKDPQKSGTAYEVAEKLETAAYGESGVTSWRLTCWALIFRSWLRRAQSELAREYDFSSVQFHDRLPSILDELYGYLGVLSRGPPVSWAAVAVCVREYGTRTGRFLLGVPSQGRRGALKE